MKSWVLSDQFLHLPEEKQFPSASAAVQALAAEATQTLQDALDLRGQATLVVPGGRSAALCLPPVFDSALDWSRVRIFLTDERWVPPSSPDSNERLVRGMIAGRPAQQSKFIGFWQSGQLATVAARSASGIVSNIPRPIDLVICGMGEDGHVASIFPGQNFADGNTNNDLIVSAAPTPPHARVTLTMQTLSANRRLLILIIGAKKRAIYRSLDPNLPISQLLQRSLGHTTIFVDEPGSRGHTGN
ncbi:6-phosphogluconolactonase [Alphaproteobacteria bacterium]|nr:6-phosphogluconolactonase [Alphaproteobacteria bacterium]